jgi:hypothetical protein
MTKPETRGAAISARARTPSIDLASLADLVSKSIAANTSIEGASALPLAVIDEKGKRLRINLRGVLGRLLSHKDFKPTFSSGETSGFIRDTDFPPRGTAAKMGGRLLPGSEAKATKAIGNLHEVICQELDTALAGTDIRLLVAPSAQQVLETLAKQLGVKLPSPPTSASLVPIEFASAERKADERERDVARVLTAIEVIEGRDWLDLMLAGARRKLENDEIPAEEIDSIIETIRLQRDQPGSQIRRFLEFLDDEALARVRLQVTFELMDAIAEQSTKPGLKAYVSRVRECFDRFGSAKGDALHLDASKIYGTRNNSDLAEHLRKALFYNTLPVWPEWSVQLFEARVEPANGFATKREVSYRFRVNGQNPETGKSAFTSRLDRLEERILEEPGPDINVQRAIAELVFLRLVTPSAIDAPKSEEVTGVALRIAAALKADPVAAVRNLIDELRAREAVMDSLADALIKVLQTKSRKLVDSANRTSRRFYVTVQKNIIDWTALLSMSSTSTEVLVKNERAHDNVAWFNHLVVSDDPVNVPMALASYYVDTNLLERSITPVDGKAELRMERDNSEPLLPVRFVPFKFEKSESGPTWLPEDASHKFFDQGCGVDIEYEIRPLSLTRAASDTDKANYEQWRTVSCTAFALVTYLVLWEVLKRAKSAEGMKALAAYLLRLQPKGRESFSTDGNAAVYAISHAIERALCRELPVKMQGFLTQGKVETAEWRKRGTLVALQGGFPLDSRLRESSTVDRVALISYVTRPCDIHPLKSDADGFLFVSRTYRADAHKGGFRLYMDAMQSRLVDTRKSFREPQLVLEEIARLRAAGYKHVILLSHHFGNRHIGRAADRHAPHGSFEFLEEASSKFPDVFVYPLRRDVFPATRLHKRLGSESAFEVLSFKEHEKMFDAQERDMLRSLMPIYTFATLAVVGEEGRPQSGFCTYFLDVEQRLSSFEWSETARQNILGIGAGKPVREALIGVLRGLHYLESEKSAAKMQVLPVLDPFGWATPSTTSAAGELPVLERRRYGPILLSFPAVLAHVTKVLHKEAEQ